MVWIVKPLELEADPGKFRLTATSDEDGGGPFGDNSHPAHDSAQEAMECPLCREFCDRKTGLGVTGVVMDEMSDRNRGTVLSQDEVREAWNAPDTTGSLLRLQKMCPVEGDTLIVTSTMPEEETVEFVEHVKQIAGEGVTIIVTDEKFGIECFDEETMNQAGWFRATEISDPPA